MSAQRLSAKSIRRIEASTGLRITRAWAHGGYVFDFVVADPDHPDRHRHGAWNKVTGEWGWDDGGDRILHYGTCRELFPGFGTDRTLRG